MNLVEIGTKEKIMEAARILFAEKGFEGTSIREIAKTAEVNIAAINYHFNSKENLIAEVVRRGKDQCEADLNEYLSTNNPSLDDALVYVYRYFIEKSQELLTIFKIIISSDGIACKLCPVGDKNNFGPPGGDLIGQIIQRDLGKVISEEDQHWAVRTLFSHVIHTAIIQIGQVAKHQNIPYFEQEDIEKGIRRLVHAILIELKAT